MDSSKKGPENGCHKYKGVKHTRAGTWVAQIWEPHRKSKLYLGTFRSALEAALAYDEAARQMFGHTTKLNFPNYSLCEDHDEDCPTVITVSTSDSTNSSISRDPFVNIKRKARTSVVNRGDGRSMSRFIKILEPELKEKAVRKASRERSIKSLVNVDIQRLCTAEKLTYLGYQGAQTGLHDGNIDQKDEASSSVSSQPIDCTRKRKRKTVRQRRAAKGVAEIQGKWKDCNNKLDFLVNEEKPMRRAHSEGSKKGRMNGKDCQQKEANAVRIYRGVRKRLHGKWGADIWLPGMGSRLWLGTFRSEMEAALAYDEGARAMHGSYARLNFPNYSLSEDFNKDSPSCMIISSADSTSYSIAEDSLNNIMRKARTRKANNKDGEGISRVDEGHQRLQSLSTLQIVEEATEPELKEEEVGKASGEPWIETGPDKVDHICLWGEIFSVDELLDALNSVPPDFHGADVTEIACHSLDMKLLTEMGQTTSDGFDFLRREGQEKHTII